MSIRVLQVIGGSKFGGGVWVILSYVEALQEHGCSVTVCTSVEPVADAFRRAGCQIVSVPEMDREINPVRDVRALAHLTKVCREGRFDVVHTHTSKGGFLGRAAARLARVPVVLHTAHGFAFHEASPRRTVAFYASLERLAAHWCDRIITVAEFHRAWAIRLGIAPPARIVTIRNGISRARLTPSRSRADTRRAIGVGDGDVLLMSIGRLAKQKGLETLLDAIPAVLKRDVRVKVALPGEGPLRAQLESDVKARGLEGVVSFLGFRSDVGDLLSAADLVVAPTLREGLSISVLEAMAMGKPIVTTNVGSNLELVEDGVSGLLIRPDDSVALAESILRLLADSALALRLGAAARDRFDAGFTERAMKDSLWSLYRHLIQEKIGARAGLVAQP